MSDRVARPPASRFERLLGWAERIGLGTSGERPGTNVAGSWLRAYGVIAVLVLAVDTVNILTVLHDAASYGAPPAPWQPVVWEYSSGVATLAVCTTIALALRIAPPGETAWPRLLVSHGLASLVFSLAHVALMTLLRVAVYAAVGARYRVASVDFPYEYRKDLLAYAVIGAIFWVMTRRATAPAQPAGREPRPEPVRSFDIDDGRATHRTPVASILAVRAAANYVEFHLDGGRTRLMRIALRDVERQLAPAGFVRSHRSWVVNSGRVAALTPAGSGDFQITLDTGLTLPCSRRYPNALAAITTAAGAVRRNSRALPLTGPARS